MKRVLVLLPVAGYRSDDVLSAARRLGVEVVTAADHCHRLAPEWGLPPIMALHFDQPLTAAETVLRELDRPIDAVLAIDDSGVELAALLAARLGLPGNPADAVRTLRDKLAFRQLQRRHGFAHPDFHHLAGGEDPLQRRADWAFPLVVKARRLSASRGVIRADDPDALARAVARVRAIQARTDRDAAALGLVIESFIPGREVALEGLLDRGELNTLALFDKPDPLDGPHFEETIFVTPSRLDAALQRRIADDVARACRAAGLVTGAVHAEARVDGQGIWLLEIAPRSIGGLCGRVLRHGLGMSLEELLLRQALQLPLPQAGAGEASGVMMIPIPRRGIFHGVDGIDQARKVPGVTELTLTAQRGQLVAPPPDAASYLGFIFARGQTPAQAEAALRAAHARLRLDIRTEFAAA